MYGTADQVAAKARVWTRNGVFVNDNEDYAIKGTNPTLDTVKTWITNISAQMDVALGTSWFIVPVDPERNPDAYNAIAEYVCSLVADQCHLANGVDREVSPMGKIMQDLSKWVFTNEDGLVQMGLQQRQASSTKKQTTFRTIG